MHILYAADRPADLYLIGALREIGHVVDVLADAGDAPVRLGVVEYDAAVLDGAEPSLARVRTLAAAARDALLLVVADRLAGQAPAALRAGADACFERPVQVQELQERLRALMRVSDRLRLDPAVSKALAGVRAERALVVDGRRAPLSPLEVQILTYLMRRAGEVVSPERLHAAVWGEGVEPNPERVRTTVGRLRRKLAMALDRTIIEAASGRGYVYRVHELHARDAKQG